ncbi:MAG: hypothetical protein JXQ73_10690 [Phycisphaerae bacterium]|nr:hypothetical protein [Phycisphaerae bacterium]
MKLSRAIAAISLVTMWWSSPGLALDRPGTSTSSRGSSVDHYYGVAIQVDTSNKPVEMFGPLLREIASLGSNTVLIGADAYQKNASSGKLYLDSKKTPTEEQWKELLTIARKECGLKVILAPKILLSDPLGTEWRGVIQPPSWRKWFIQYRRIMNHFADVAQANGVEVLMIGSEMVSAEKHTEEWLEVIQQVRKRYDGKLSYSANWDHYQPVKFWDKLDLIGMTSYYKLSDDPGPTVQHMVEAWEPIKKSILEWQQTIGKPILFTEVGWCSQEGASIEPWNYYHKQEATGKGLEEQRACYEAFMRSWSDVPQVGGVIWWEWTTYGGGKDCYNYTPKGKPAEGLLREWFAKKCAKTKPPRREASGPRSDAPLAESQDKPRTAWRVNP